MTDLWDVMHLWVGRAQVKPQSGNTVLDGAAGAIVPAVAYARDEDDFASKVSDVLYEKCFDVMGVGEIERYQGRLDRGDVDDEMQEIAASLSEENPVGLCAFEALP